MSGDEKIVAKAQPDPRAYSAGTRSALSVLSQGTCYFPGCATSTIVFIDGEPFINYEIAHIRDAKPGNRYVKDMTDDARRSFSNVVLLCKPHHTLVDKAHPDDYSIPDLEEWKANREGGGLAALKGLGGLTEERLEALIRGAVASASVGQAAVRVEWTMDARSFEDAVAGALRAEDDITLRRFLEQCETDWRRLVSDRDGTGPV
jgi:hypothetical protein